MKSIITFTTVLIGLFMATEGFPQEFNGEAVYPPEECNLLKTEIVCDPLVTKECKEMPVCYDSMPENYPEIDNSIIEGGSSTLAVLCDYINGALTTENTIYIGAHYQWVLYPPHFENTGEFAFCKNGLFVKCDIVGNPLIVTLGSEHDHAETTDVLRTCGSHHAIGPWSSLTVYQDTSLEMYACAGPDTLRGSPNDDYVFAGSENDTVYGLGEGDFICGDSTPSGTLCYDGGPWENCGPGDTGPNMQDFLYGGGGPDGINGNGGDDYIWGEAGDDCLFGEDGKDNIGGGEGNDSIFGDANDDTLWGGRGCDHVYGGAGIDTIYLYMTDASTPDLCSYPGHNEADGGEGIDYIYGAKDAENHMWGGSENDTIVGNNMEDWICGGNGISDHLYGGGGDDIVVDCLGGAETLLDGEMDCDNTIYGEAGKYDTMCYYAKGTIQYQAQFCLDGGDGEPDLYYCDDPQVEGCVPISCYEEASINNCTHNDEFDCNCV